MFVVGKADLAFSFDVYVSYQYFLFVYPVMMVSLYAELKLASCALGVRHTSNP